MNIWTEEIKLNENSIIRKPGDIQTSVQTLISPQQLELEESLANCVIAYVAFMSHKNNHLYENAIHKLFDKPIENSIRSINQDQTFIVEINEKDFKFFPKLDAKKDITPNEFKECFSSIMNISKQGINHSFAEFIKESSPYSAEISFYNL
jgi:hypothetical protein